MLDKLCKTKVTRMGALDNENKSVYTSEHNSTSEYYSDIDPKSWKSDLLSKTLVTESVNTMTKRRITKTMSAVRDRHNRSQNNEFAQELILPEFKRSHEDTHSIIIPATVNLPMARRISKFRRHLVGKNITGAKSQTRLKYPSHIKGLKGRMAEIRNIVQNINEDEVTIVPIMVTNKPTLKYKSKSTNGDKIGLKNHGNEIIVKSQKLVTNPNLIRLKPLNHQNLTKSKSVTKMSRSCSGNHNRSGIKKKSIMSPYENIQKADVDSDDFKQCLDRLLLALDDL